MKINVNEGPGKPVSSSIIKVIAASILAISIPFQTARAAGLGADAADSSRSVPMAEPAPVIDGRLDDPAWESALRFEDFKTFEPDFGKDGSQKSVAYLTYDSRNIYFAIRAFETDPSKIKASICRRDAMGSDDLFGVILDTFNDMQSGYGFMVNPYGIQGDGMMNSQGNLDDSHDMVWYSKGRIDEEGWTAEAQIPLESIRFRNREETAMRVLFFRFIIRTSEQLSYPAFDPDKGSPLMQSMPLAFTGLEYKRVAEIIPAFTYGNRYAADAGELVKAEEDKDFSVTGKIGLTSDLTLDGTYNPDFSQVEADAGQVDINLRYQLYFQEKRPFFMEGADLWNFGGMVEDGPVAAVVYTRTIINPGFGFKLYGKITPRDTLAAVYARDSLPGDTIDEHPDFTIARYKHALKNDSYLGGFYTGRETNQGFNRVGGLDGMFRLTNKSIFSFHILGGFTRAEGEEATKDDHSLALDYVFSDRKWMIDLGYQDISPDFRIDTGFVTRTGVRRISAFAMYQIYPKSKFFQKIEPFYWSYHLYDTVYDMWETLNFFVVRFQLPRSTQVRFEGIAGNEVFAGGRFNRSALGFRFWSQIVKQVYLEFFLRRGGSIYYDPDAPYQGYGNNMSAFLRYQPVGKLDFSLSLTYSDFYRQADHEKIYDYIIMRSRNTFQVNKYLFMRAIFEYNFYRKRLTADGLVSFTYIPGTVFYVGYGSAFERLQWTGSEYLESDRFLETKRGFFLKLSYLYRF